LIFFLRGGLPWQDLESDFHRRKQDKIMDQKMKYHQRNYVVVCLGNLELLEYARNLDFKAEPDYHYLVSLFDDLMIENGFEYDNVYPWTVSDSYTEARVYVAKN
jgi:casein kinase I family protein HRR25